MAVFGAQSRSLYRLTGVCSPASLGRVSSAYFSTSNRTDRSCKVLVVGGGTGGSAIANKWAGRFVDKSVIVVEPSEDHFYQPLWTLVGAGLKNLGQSQSETSSILSKKLDWIKDKAASFHPEQNMVRLESGEEINYEYLVVSMGIQLDYHKVKGLPEAFESDPRVCSNYHRSHVMKTRPALDAIQSGNAIFTFPNTPIKCAGAPQKIVYLADEHFRQTNKRDKINVMYNTSLPVIFGIPRYAEALLKVVEKRDINVNYRRNLIEVRPDTSEAIFQLLDSESGETETYKYDFLHAAPPCSAPDPLKGSALVDSTNFVDLNRSTLQHTTFPNVFGIGDCTNLPTAKTAAAVAGQVGVLNHTMKKVMAGKKPKRVYNGYTSCPLVTKHNQCILAEFGYDGAILETFPINQAKERVSAYVMKAHLMPMIYWQMLVKGMWHGPGLFRKMMRLGFVKN